MSCQLPPHSFLYRTRYMHHLSKEVVLPWHLENVFLVYVSIYLKELQFTKLNFLNNKNKVLFFMHTLYSNYDASKDYTHLTAIKRSQEGWSIFTTGIVWSYFFQSYAGALDLSAEPKSGWGAMALRADSQQDKCMGRAPENSKERTVSFSHTVTISKWLLSHQCARQGTAGAQQTGKNNLRTILWLW